MADASGVFSPRPDDRTPTRVGIFCGVVVASVLRGAKGAVIQFLFSRGV